MNDTALILPIVLLDMLGFLLIGAGVGLAHSETLAPEKAFALCNLGGLSLVASLLTVHLLVLRKAGFVPALIAFAMTAGIVIFGATQTPLFRLPWINDISTDLEAPPPVAVPGASDVPLPAEFKPAIQQAYADLKPLVLPKPPAEVLKKLADTVKALPNLENVRVDDARGLVQAVEVTPLMHFRDDFTVRVKSEGTGARVDVRSRSRVGKSDLGANAARIRRVLALAAAATK